MTTVCLVRHGVTDWNREGRLQGREDIELNETGRMQARLIAMFLGKQERDLVMTSPLKRAAETASVIAERLGIEDAIQMPEFVERDYGESSGMTAEESSRMFPDGDVPGLEDRSSVRDRCMRGLQALTREHAGRSIVIVAHGAVINSILAVVSRGEIGTGKTRLGNACINLPHFHHGAWEVQSYNSTSHLMPNESL